jgi:hypothetical protein
MCTKSQSDPTKMAPDRGKAVGATENETAEAIPGIDVDLIRMLAECLSKAD